MMWARLAGGYSGESAAKDAVLGDIFSAMAAYPEMVSGTGRLDLAIARLSDGDCIAKAGVDGIYTVGVKSRGLGIAIKVADGALSVLYATAVAVLKQLKVVEQLNELSLSRWNDPVIRNLRGIEVGQLKTRVSLQRS